MSRFRLCLITTMAILTGVTSIACNTAADDGSEPTTGLFLPTDGKRLKTRWFQGPDGQRSFLGWYDSMLRVRCSFRTAMDGEVRCLPNATAAAGHSFADPACATPVAVTTSAACQSIEFATLVDTSNACQSRYRVYRLGEKLEVEEFYADPARCFRLTKSDEVLYTLGEEMPVTTFVRLRRKVESGSAPLRLAVWEGDDGARGEAGWQLAETDEPCSMMELEDERLHCVAGARSVDSTFGDADCRESLVSFRPACESPPRFAQKPATGCPAKPSPLHEVGPKATALHRVRSNDNMCAVAVSPLGSEYRSVGQAVPAEDHPAFEAVIDKGQHRLRRRKWAAPGGRLTGANWFDSVLEEPCSPLRLDGKYRCVPGINVVASHGYFLDEGCTQPLHIANPGECPPRHITLPDGPGSCALDQTVHALGERHTGDYYLRARFSTDTSAGIRCTLYPASPDRDVYLLTPLPAEDFVEFKVIEPGANR